MINGKEFINLFWTENYHVKIVKEGRGSKNFSRNLIKI